MSKVQQLRQMREKNYEVGTLTPRQRHALAICDAHAGTVEAVIEVGRRIIAAKEDPALAHGEFLVMIKNDLPFGASTAQRLMKVAADDRLSNAAHVQHLPPSWGTLYELTKLDDDEFDAVAPRLTPEITRREVKRLVAEVRTPEPPEEEPVRTTETKTQTGARVDTGTETLEEVVRRGIALDMPVHATAAELGLAINTYGKARYILLLADDPDLSEEDRETVNNAIEMMNLTGTVATPYASVESLVETKWGTARDRRGAPPDRVAELRMERFMRAYGGLVQACMAARHIDIPLLSESEREEYANELSECVRSVSDLRDHIRGG